MSVVGVDFGTQSTRIAIVRAGGVDVICNEVSDRATPSMVSFDQRRRYAGDASRTQLIGNFKNTVSNLPRLIGKRCGDQGISREASFIPCTLTIGGENPSLPLAANLNYRDESRQFTDIELVASFMTKVKAIVGAETRSGATCDVVVAVPCWWGELERRRLADAVEVSGLKCVRTITDTTAAAINYGIAKTGIPADVARRIVIVDIGYSGAKACLVELIRGRAEVLAHTFDSNLGGRDFDECLVTHFADEIRQKSGRDITGMGKVVVRLRTACERIKKVLSGIALTTLELDSVVDDRDFTLSATREQFETLSKPLLARIEALLEPLHKICQSQNHKVDAVEIIGGSTRIPAVKDIISRIFDVPSVSTTLNADEAVARGAALQCAMESPSVRVREYRVVDTIPASSALKVIWRNGASGDVAGESPLFSCGTRMGEAKSLVLPPVLPVTIEFVPFEGEAAAVAAFEVTGALESGLVESSSPVNCKLVVKALIDVGGLARIPSASIEYQVTETLAPETDSGEPTTRTVTKCVTLNVASKFSLRTPPAEMLRLREAEVAMALNDALVAETDDARNAVEECIYEVRGRLNNDESYISVTSPEELESLLNYLTECENWLYDEGANVECAVYKTRLADIESKFEGIRSKVRAAEKAKRDEAAAASLASASTNETSCSSTSESLPEVTIPKATVAELD